MSNAQAGPIIGVAFAILIVAIIFSTVTWEIDVEETYYTQEQYTHEETFERERQVTKWPWPWQKATQVQYSVKNTAPYAGTFVYKFHFDNGKYLKTKTTELYILPESSETLIVDSPLAGISTFELEVVPPHRNVPQTRTVKQKVNVWGYLPHLLPFIK